MTVVRIAFLVRLGWPLVLAAAPARRSANDKERILYRKPLDADRELVVVQGVDHPIADVKGLQPEIEGASSQRDAIFLLRIELRTAKSTPLPLAWQPYWRPAPGSGNVKVLDLLRYETRVVLPTGGNATLAYIVLATFQGGTLTITRFAPFGSYRLVSLAGADWTSYAIRPDLDGEKLRVKLTAAKDGQIEATVEDLLPNSKRSRFLIGENEWKSGQVHAVHQAKP